MPLNKNKGKGRPAFKPTFRPTAAALDERKEKVGGNFDSPYQSKFRLLKLSEENTIRVLPATFEDAQHWGLDVYLHSGIGPDNSTYLCPKHMYNEKCPICEEQKRATAYGDEDYAKSINAYFKVLVWAIDRNHEDEGPLLLALPKTVDKALVSLSIDKKTKEIFDPTDIDEGYDFSFDRTGKGMKTKYEGFQLARRPSPLSDDPDQAQEWLDFIMENPLDTALKVYDYDYLKSTFSASNDSAAPADDKPKTRAGRATTKEDDAEDAPKPRRRAAAEDDPEDAPKPRRRAAAEDDPEDAPRGRASLGSAVRSGLRGKVQRER
jgi:hypothetical protein